MKFIFGKVGSKTYTIQYIWNFFRVLLESNLTTINYFPQSSWNWRIMRKQMEETFHVLSLAMVRENSHVNISPKTPLRITHTNPEGCNCSQGIAVRVVHYLQECWACVPPEPCQSFLLLELQTWGPLLSWAIVCFDSFNNFDAKKCRKPGNRNQPGFLSFSSLPIIMPRTLSVSFTLRVNHCPWWNILTSEHCWLCSR